MEEMDERAAQAEAELHPHLDEIIQLETQDERLVIYWWE
jgi:hypothetical protein